MLITGVPKLWAGLMQIGGDYIKTMIEQQLTHNDKRHERTLSQRLDRVSIEYIKELSNKLKGCEPKP